MHASEVLWEKWQEQVKGLFPKLHGHQQKQLALTVAGMVISGCGVLQRIGEHIQQQGWSQAKMSSIERRLERFLANDQVVVSELWKAFLGQVLPYWNGKKLMFVLDCTPYNAQFSIVYVGLLIHSRVLPVAWAVMPGQESWEEGQWDIVARLLDTVCAFLPEAECTLLADRGLAGAPLVHLCVQRKWHYVLRICQEHPCRRQMGKKKVWSGWSSFKSFIHTKGQQWYGRARLWQENTLEAYVSACWDETFEEAWLLICDLPAGKARIRTYALRMRVESTFQDTKTRGWNIEAAQLKVRAHLDRLLLALFLAVWWVGHLAASCIHHGQRDRFDRHDRRDKGIFRLGRLWLLDILRRARHPAALSHCLPFRKKEQQWIFALRF
jgi:Transposase DDE domain